METYLFIEKVVNCDTRGRKSHLYSSSLGQICEPFSDRKCLLLSMSSPVMYRVVAHLLTAYPPVSYPAAQDIGQKYQYAVQEGHLPADIGPTLMKHT